MAIERRILNTDDCDIISQNLAELGITDGYFDEYVKDTENNVIRFMKDGNELFNFQIKTSDNSINNINIIYFDGESTQSTQTGLTCGTMLKCAHGILVIDRNEIAKFFVTKDNNGNTVILLMKNLSGSTQTQFNAASYNTQALVNYYGPSYNNIAQNYMTVLAPIPTNDRVGSYCENLFITPFIELKGQAVNFTMNGIAYIGNAVVVLKDE